MEEYKLVTIRKMELGVTEKRLELYEDLRSLLDQKSRSH